MMNTPSLPRARRSSFALITLLAGLAALPLVGCAGAKAAVHGKVIQGDVSFMGVVDAADQRLKGPGIAGAEVTAISDPTRPAASTVIGQGKSDAAGNFSLAIADQSSFIKAAGFSAQKPGYISATSTMPLPQADRRLLVILQPVHPAPTPAPAPVQRTK